MEQAPTGLGVMGLAMRMGAAQSWSLPSRKAGSSMYAFYPNLGFLQKMEREKNETQKGCGFLCPGEQKHHIRLQWSRPREPDVDVCTSFKKLCREQKETSSCL